jgi:hypothetical protein
LQQAEPIQSESKQKYQQFYVKTENWQEKNENKEIGGKIQWNTEHDKIVQYFPQSFIELFPGHPAASCTCGSSKVKVRTPTSSASSANRSGNPIEI